MNRLSTTVVPAADRFFRQYLRHCTRPDLDSLLDLLNSLHGLNDKLRGNTSLDLFGSSEFIALKAFRNFFHHQAELIHHVRILAAGSVPSISAELAYLCLIERSLVETAMSRIASADLSRAKATLNWYGPIVDIQPCLFNAAVDVFETLEGLNLDLVSDEFAMFRATYQDETEHGHSHRVTGRIATHAANAELLLAEAFGVVRSHNPRGAM